MSNVDLPNAPVLEIRPPARFNEGAVLVFCAYGLLLFAPAVIAVLVVSSLAFGPLTFLIPVAALACATFLLPLGFGNRHVKRIAPAWPDSLPPESEAFLVQVTLTPRLKTGLRSLLDDADDIGWLYFVGPVLHFLGDSVELKLPLSSIRSTCSETAGARWLYLHSRVSIELSGVGQYEKAAFAERSSSTLPGSRRAARRLQEAILKAAGSA